MGLADAKDLFGSSTTVALLPSWSMDHHHLSREPSAELGRADRVPEAEAVVGKYADPTGVSTVAEDHDDHLADAYGA